MAFLLYTPCFAEPPDEGLTLQDCYQLALKNSEKIAQQKELIKEAEARFTQSFSQILPRATYSYTHRWQDGSGTSNFTQGEVPESKIIFSQPLFSGFKEFAAMNASKAEKKQRLYEEERAKELLFVDVYDAFYFLLSYEEDIQTLENIKSVLAKRIEELKSREELGRTRPSEILTAQVRSGRLEAELEAVSSQRETVKNLLEFLIAGKVTKMIDNPAASSEDISTVDHYLPLCRNRSDVLAAQEAYHSLKSQVTAAKGEFFPSVDLEGNYYTKRIGNSSGVDWDMTLSVEVPIFEGKENLGILQETRARANQAELNFKETQRKAELETRDAYTQLKSDIKRKETLQKALADAEKNYALHLEDYRLNSVSNLDVLQSLEDLQEVHRDFIAAKNQAQKSYWNLKVAAGEAPYDPF